MMLRFIALVGYLLSSPLQAQTATYCATYPDNASEDCSFTSFAMCQQSVSGLGGYCEAQSEAPAMPPPPLFRLFPAPAQPNAPPPAGSSGSPMTLPDAPQQASPGNQIQLR